MRVFLTLALLFGIGFCTTGCSESEKPDITKHPDYNPNPDPRAWDLYGGSPLDPKTKNLGKTKKGRNKDKKKSEERNKKG